MNRIRAVAVGILASGVLACAALAQQADTQHMQAVETSRDSRMIGIGIVRLINNAEASYANAHGMYASWKTLLDSGAISDAQKSSALPGMKLSDSPESDSAEVVPGWALSLITSADGPSYMLSLRNTQDPCAFSFFSDQWGFIYQGGSADCSIDLKPTKIMPRPR